MKEKMDELVARFRSLQGDNLQGTKRNFNELIDVIRRDVPLETDLNALIAYIEPKTKFERILKVEMLIRFDRYDALLEILKGGNPMLIGKVLKYWKLFEVVFSNINSQTLVGQIFPQTSFSTRTKIITRLSTNLKNEELADEYFHAIEDKYGLSVAKGMLPACSLDLIKSTVATYKLTLTSRQLLKIVKRHRSFLSYYLYVLNQAHGKYFDFSSKYPQVLKYVAQVDEQVFWELFKKYELKSKFGRHMTPRLYESGKKVVTVTDYKLNLFNYRELHKVIGKNDGELRPLLLQLLPKRVNYFATEYSSSGLKTLIDCFPKHKRYEVLNDCFEEVYGKNIHELLSLNTPQDIMELMPVPERETILDRKVSTDEDLIYLYSPKKAISLLQERIKLTSTILIRSNLLVQLNKTCMLSRDSEALLEVLKYVLLRHRNDDVALSNFMISLQEWPKLEKFSVEHWKYIKELLNICNRMTGYKLNGYDINIMLKYLLHLVENNLSYDEFMESFLLHLVEKTGNVRPFYNRNYPKWEKIIYEYFARLLPNFYTGDKFESLSFRLLSSIATYNNKNPRNRITISKYPLLMEAVKSQMTKETYFSFEVLLAYYLKFEDEATGDQMFWDNYKKVCTADMIIWYLQQRPNKLLEHLDKILTPQIIQQLYNYYKLPKILNLVSMLPNISEKIVNFSLKALHDNNAAVSKFAAISLSYLVPKEKYFEAVRPFVPLSGGKIDFKLAKENFVFTQEAVVDGLSNVDDSASCLPMLLEFCVGDYMKYASKSLYHVTSHTPESKLELFLNSLYNSAVSVRKHAVNITVRVSPKSVVYTFLKNSGQNDKHPSLRKAIFKNTLGYFIANPSEEFWSLLRDNVKIIDENDRETMDCLTNLYIIPRKYFSEYFSMVYTILSSNKEKEVQAKKYALLASVRNELVNELNANYLTAVIKDTFPKDIKKTDFYLKCLFHATGSNSTRVLDLVFSILKDCVEENFKINKAGTDLYNIISAICLKAVTLRFGKDLIVKFIEFWTSAVQQGKLQEEYLLLQLTNAYLDFHSDGNPRKYGARLSEVLEEWVGLYDPSVTFIFTERLNIFLIDLLDFTSGGKKEFEFIDGFLSANDADFNYIATLNLLFRRTYWNEIKAKYSSVLIRIGEHKSSVVQIYLHRQLRSMKSEQYFGVMDGE